MLAVLLQRVADRVLEVVDGYEVRKERQNVLDLDQVVALLLKLIKKFNLEFAGHRSSESSYSPVCLVLPTDKVDVQDFHLNNRS